MGKPQFQLKSMQFKSQKWQVFHENTATFLFYLISFLGIWTFQVLYRFCFIFFLSDTDSFGTIFWEASKNGFNQDLSASAYFLLPLVVTGWLCNWLPKKIKVSILASLAVLLTFYGIVIGVADAAIYHYWGTHLNSQAISYLAYPQRLLVSVPFMVLTVGLVLSILTVIFLYRLFLKWINSNGSVFDFTDKKSWFISLSITLILAITARGGLDKIPLSITDPYKSKIESINTFGVNVFWNANYHIFSAPEYPDISIFANGSFTNTRFRDVYTMSKFKNGNYIGVPQSLVIIVLEGISAQTSTYLNGYHYNGLPLLDSWAQKWGVGINHCYATGDRTDKGLASVFSGWPGQPWQGILHEPDRFKMLPHLSRNFARKNFNTHFFYGGDANFANVKAYMSAGGTNSIWDISQLKENANSGNWGVHDSDVLMKMYQVLSRESKPYFASLLTLSSHEPYDIIKDKQKNEIQNYYASVNYVDRSLNAFFNRCFKDEGFDNTCFMVISDHGKHLETPETHFGQREFFRIPFYLIGKNLKNTMPKIHAKCFSQADIYNSINDWFFNKTDNSAKFSRSIFQTNHPNNAVFHLYEVAGIIEKDRMDWITTNPVLMKPEMPLNERDSAILSLETEIISDFFQMN